MSGFNGLSGYVEEDVEKKELLERIMLKFFIKDLKSFNEFSRPVPGEYSIKANKSAEVSQDEEFEPEVMEDVYENKSQNDYLETEDLFANEADFLMEPKPPVAPSKICPKCGRKFMEWKIHCPDCLVTLKSTDDSVDIRSIASNPKLEYVGGVNDFSTPETLFTDDNLERIEKFDFTMDDFNDIIRSIKIQGFNNLENLIRKHLIGMDSLNIRDKVTLIAKSFAPVEYKDYGVDLGYFEFDKIYVDDRQLDSLQITTIIHELSHFFIKEILTQALCRLLDISKSHLAEATVIYILSNNSLNKLVDEYAAHCVEGRFTVFGYQDYSSFIALQNDLQSNEADIAKTIGNTFSIHIKDLLEAFIDWDLREEIKEQFIHDTVDRPDYRQLKFENSSKLTDEGFLKAIWLILFEGLQNVDVEKVKEYEKEF